MPVVDVAGMCFTDLDTSSVQVDVRSAMVRLVRAGTIGDGVFSVGEEALVAHVAQGVVVGALARVAVRLAAPVCACVGSVERWLDFTDLSADFFWDGGIVIGMPERARLAFDAGAVCIVRA